MNTRDSRRLSNERGVGLIEVMVGIVIGMLIVLMIFQVYLVTEGQKRTITSSNDAQENASYGLFLLGQDLAGAGNVISASTAALSGCAMLRPIPVVIARGRHGLAIPTRVTVFFGGSGSLSTPTPLLNNAAVNTSPPGVYQVAGPVAFSPNDVIAAVQGTNCTLSTINAGRGHGRADDPASQRSAHTLTATPGNNNTATYNATSGIAHQSGSRGQVRSDSVFRRSGQQHPDDPEPAARRACGDSRRQQCRQSEGAVRSRHRQRRRCGYLAVSDRQLVIGQPSAAAAATWQQIQAVRVAIVTRSDKYETDAVTPGPLGMFCTPAPCAVSMTLTADQQHYRYKVLETIVPLRNAVWNAP